LRENTYYEPLTMFGSTVRPVQVAKNIKI